jgi:secreted trypsin-like serine protease
LDSGLVLYIGSGCGQADSPDLYTSVFKYKDWIIEKAGKTLYSENKLNMFRLTFLNSHNRTSG